MPRGPLLLATGALAAFSPPLRAGPSDQLWLGLQFSVTLGPAPEGADPDRRSAGVLLDAHWQRVPHPNHRTLQLGQGPFLQVSRRWQQARLAAGWRAGAVELDYPDTTGCWLDCLKNGHRIEGSFDADLGLALKPTGELGIHLGAGAQLSSFGARFHSTVPLRRKEETNWAEPTISSGLTLPLLPEDYDYSVPGRPVRLAGRPVMPEIEISGSERSLTPEALRWLRDAQMEMAAVTAFLALARDLRALRAPSRLVDRALRAAKEELGHAGLCLAMGVRRAGPGVGARLTPLQLPNSQEEDRAARFSRVVRESLVDGVQGEGQAAEAAVSSALQAPDPAERATWERIAAEEAGHARLARGILDWALRADPGRARRAIASV